MKSSKTTLAGIAAILVAAASVLTGFSDGTPVDWTAVIGAVIAGVGLIAARDHNVTSEQAGAK
jgi:peptidoglycan/LPS O-acetylase OafA/YrhL